MKKSYNNDLVSVIIPTYNAGKYLKASLESIINQTYKKLEIIIVDDGSTDDSIDSIKGFEDERITIISQKNKGKSVALNNALDRINGEYWIIQDADDLSYLERIDEQLDILKKNKDVAAVFVGHDLLIKGKKFAPIFRKKTCQECKSIIDALLMPAHDATGMYRSKMVEGMRFDSQLRIGQGYDFILRLGEKEPLYVLDKCLYTYRINYDSVTRKKPNKNIKYVIQVKKNALKRRNIKKNIGYNFSEKESKKKEYTIHNHIIPHCMESVICLKEVNKIGKAINVGLKCIKMKPFDYYFYKPFIYSIVPNAFVKHYRYLKEKRQGIESKGK